MTEKVFMQGNIALGWGAVYSDCDAYYGYPITPQNEVTEWFSKEFPKRGKVFLQTASETATMNMLYGSGGAGARTMASTSGPGWALMQETMSHCANGEIPVVIAIVQRGGPGGGHVRHAQMDYFTATRGGGHGHYRTPALAPANVQEVFDLTQLAFWMADHYRNPVLIVSDAIIGQTGELLELKKIEFPPLPPKEWAVMGKALHQDVQTRRVLSSQGLMKNPGREEYLDLIQALDDKYKEIEAKEVRYETKNTEDAELTLVAFGYCARMSEEAMNMARAKGLRVGLIRPITLWPYPYKIVNQVAQRCGHMLVVEDNLGMMIDDVRIGVEGRAQVHHLGSLARHTRIDRGIILPERILQEVETILS